jgi:hypothetical protein
MQERALAISELDSEQPQPVLDVYELQQTMVPDAAYDDENDELKRRAEQAVQRLLDIDPSDTEEKRSGIAAVEQMAVGLQKKAAFSEIGEVWI